MNKFRLFIFLIFFTQMMNGTAWADEEIRWVTIKLPPFHYIPDEKNKDQSITGDLMNFFNKELGMSQIPEVFSSKRIFAEIKNGEMTGNPGLKKTATRSEHTFFSNVPSVFLPTHVLAVREDTYKKHNNIVSITEILKQNKTVLGLQIERGWGLILDAIIIKNKDKIVFHHSSDPYPRLLNMLLQKRLDYVLGFPIEFEYITRIHDIKGIKYIKIKELSQYPYSVSYVGLSKTEKGKKMIEKINQILIKKRGTKEYRFCMEKWINKDNLKQYRKDYDEIFLKGKSQYWENE